MFHPTFLALYFLVSAAVATASTSHPPDNQKKDDKRIKIDLYYESQCPGCRDTITRSFREAYAAPGFLKMADVTLVPFGNARETGTAPPYQFECQHGPSECTYNAIEACALSRIKCPYKQFQFVNCVENYDEDRTPEQNYDAVLSSCATLTGNADVANDVLKCYKGPEGNALEHDMATKTGALSPAHEYVPWIVVGGKHDDAVQEKVMKSLLGYVCSEYEGPDKSPGCPREHTLRAELRSAAEGVCYPGVENVESVELQ